MHRAKYLKALLVRIITHRRLPHVLALAAIISMLPALSIGLLGDDLIQRLCQYPPERLPHRIFETGFVPDDSGRLGTVLARHFSYLGDEESARRARDYGIVPWWTKDAWQAALFRPVTAFTHWLDYRLFPNYPALMHAHNIAWYGLVVFLAASLYRKVAIQECPELGGNVDAPASRCQNPRMGTLTLPGDADQRFLIIPGVAGCLFMLDPYFYAPVAYVANRGFILALALGLFCFYSHVQWRARKSRMWKAVAAVFMLLSLLANEGGASSLAFVIAYALVLEPGSWRSRLSSLTPYAVVLAIWRTVYVAGGFGVRNIGLYIDPGYEPLSFLASVVSRMNRLLGGQLSGVAPELGLTLRSDWQVILAVAYVFVNVVCALVFLPVLRRDRVARFWAAVTLLALVPAATVYPLSKNLGFVAVGAFGVLGAFVANLASASYRGALSAPARWAAMGIALVLMLVHAPGALGARALMGHYSPEVPLYARKAFSLRRVPALGDRQVMVVNDPTLMGIFSPFEMAYRGKKLPASLHVLAAGFNPFRVKRPDANTLVLESINTDLFACPRLRPLHVVYALRSFNDYLFGKTVWKPGDRVVRKGMVIEVLTVNHGGVPKSVLCRFDKPLESEEMLWIYFDFRFWAHLPFPLPGIGCTVEVSKAGVLPVPKGNREPDAVGRTGGSTKMGHGSPR